MNDGFTKVIRYRQIMSTDDMKASAGAGGCSRRRIRQDPSGSRPDSLRVNATQWDPFPSETHKTTRQRIEDEQ